MYNNNLTVFNDGLDNDKDATAMKEEEFEEVKLLKVLEE